MFITITTYLSKSPWHQVKDVRVPAQLMRAMAAEAEAAREARAKVTNIVVVKISVMLTMEILMYM